MTNHGTKPKIARLPHPGDIIDERYRLGEAFATGGMGIIMKAEQLRTGRDVAVKLLHPHIANQKDFAARFKREAKVATLFDHSSIVRVYDVGQTDEGVLYLIMELLTGKELKEIIHSQAPLPLGRAVDIGLQMLDGLAEAHSLGVVHRDIKPSNVFICKTRRGEDEVKLLDFGVAKLVNSSETQVTATGSIAGTPSYIAPEAMVDTEDANKKAADVYAAGLVLLEMLTGRRAFEGNGLAHTLLQHLKQPVMIPEAIVDLPLGKVIRRSTAKHPDDRYVDADAMYTALKQARHDLPKDLVLKKAGRAGPIATTPANLLEQIYSEGSRASLDILRQLPQHESMPENPVLPELPNQNKGNDSTELPTMQLSGDEILADKFDAGPAKIVSSTPSGTNSVPDGKILAGGAGTASTGNFKSISIGVAIASVILVLSAILIFPGEDEPEASEHQERAEVISAEPLPEEGTGPVDGSNKAEIVVADEEIDVPSTVSISLESEPSGAAVFVDGEVIGETNFEAEFDGELPAEIRLYKEGYKEIVVSLSNDEPEQVIALEEMPSPRVESLPRPDPEPRDIAPTKPPEEVEPEPEVDVEEVEQIQQPESPEVAEGEDESRPSDVDSLIDQHLFGD